MTISFGLIPDNMIKSLAFSEARLIDPFVSSKTSYKGVTHGLSSYGYDARLGDQFGIWAESLGLGLSPSRLYSREPLDLDKGLSPGDFTNIYETEYRGIRPGADGIIIGPGEFLLAHTLEHFRIPNDVVGFVHDKSSLARLGIAVQNTVLEPGWHGQITLEISNHGPRAVVLHVGAGIVQVMFQVSLACDNPYGSEGRYQGQTGAQATVSR